MGTLIRLKAEIDNPALPILLDNGSLVDYYVGRMVRKMSEFGYVPSSAELNAVGDFMEDARNNGWLEYIKYFLPMIGDKSHYKAGCVPLIDKLHDYSVAGNVTASGANPENMFVYNGNNKIMHLGSLDGSTMNRWMRLPILPSDMQGGYTCILTGKFKLDGAKGLFGFKDNSVDGTGLQNYVNLLERSYQQYPANIHLVDDVDNKTADIIVTTFADEEEATMSGSLYNVGDGREYYRMYFTLDGSARSTTRAEATSQTLTGVGLPEDLTDPEFYLGAYGSIASYVNEVIRNFAVFDPTMPYDMAGAYSDAVFALNTALGRYNG